MSLSYSSASAVRRPISGIKAHFAGQGSLDADGGLHVPAAAAPRWDSVLPVAAAPPPAGAEPPASVSWALRAPLHEILGLAQLLRLDGELSPLQAARVDGVLGAGKRLLERLDQVLNEAASGASAGAPRRWRDIEPATDEDPMPTAAAAQAVLATPHGRRLHVMIVDDALVSRDIAAAFLRAAGHTVTLLRDGAEAVAAATRLDVDVVLMDLRMPGLDGLGATRQIRALDGKRGRVPILALTALAFTEDAAACRAAGMNGHLAKPFRFDTLCDAVLRAANGGDGWADLDHPAGSAGPRVISLSARTVVPGGALDGESGVGLAWVDIANPWHRAPVGQHVAMPHAVPAQGIEGPFKLTLTAVGGPDKRRLVDTRPHCEPPPDLALHEFHWLVYVKPDFAAIRAFNTSCDLWRWSNGSWRSVAVPGAQFSREEMHDQGWRYCGPCADKMAMIEVSAAGTA